MLEASRDVGVEGLTKVPPHNLTRTVDWVDGPFVSLPNYHQSNRGPNLVILLPVLAGLPAPWPTFAARTQTLANPWPGLRHRTQRYGIG